MNSFDMGPREIAENKPGGSALVTVAGHPKNGLEGAYWQAYSLDYGFEAEMVAARQRLITKLMLEQDTRAIVEIGCGRDLMYDHAVEAGLDFGSWLIVEPEPRFLETAHIRAANDARLRLSCCRVEETDWIGSLGPTPDLVLISSLLHEVANPHAVLLAVRRIFGPSTLLHVNVPNSGSLHRRLAVAMGITKNNGDLGSRNRKLGQQRVFSAETLRREIERAGFAITTGGGYFLKPFTHSQMMKVLPDLGPEGLIGLDKLGQEFAEFAAEIYVNACISE